MREMAVEAIKYTMNTLTAMYAGQDTMGIPEQYKMLVLVGVTRHSAGQADTDMNEKNIPPCAYF
jgi:hypothetical protein